MAFDADAAELEPDPDEEDDGPPAVVDLMRPRTVERARGCASADRPLMGRVTTMQQGARDALDEWLI